MTVSASPFPRILSGRLEYGNAEPSFKNHVFSTGCRLNLSGKTAGNTIMARMPRLVVPGYPHHVTQRGNRRMKTFFNDGDYNAYLK